MVFEREIDPASLAGKRMAVLGYGNQGRAHALNLRDSGYEVAVGARPGAGREAAAADGFALSGLSEAASAADVVVLALPDEAMGEVYASEVGTALAIGATLVFCHGFAVTYGSVPRAEGVGRVLVSPCGPGSAVRERFLTGEGVTALVATENEADWGLALAYARAIGCARAGLVRTTFAEETACDLLGEQAVLCGGMPWLARAAWEVLVEAGLSPEVAYLECIEQVRLLADLMARHGIAGMLERVSDTAEWGAYEVGPKVVDRASVEAMRSALARIRSGAFAEGWVAEAAAGKLRLRRLRDDQRRHPMEAVGERLRRSRA